MGGTSWGEHRTLKRGEHRTLKRGEHRTLKRQRLGIEERVKALQLTNNSSIERALGCDADARRLIQDIIGEQIVGREIVHGWFCRDEAEIQPWFGKIEALNRKNYQVKYWPLLEVLKYNDNQCHMQLLLQLC